MATEEQIIRANQMRMDLEQELADFEAFYEANAAEFAAAYEENIEEILQSVVDQVAAEQQRGPGIVQALLDITEEYCDEQRGNE